MGDLDKLDRLSRKEKTMKKFSPIELIVFASIIAFAWGLFNLIPYVSKALAEDLYGNDDNYSSQPEPEKKKVKKKVTKKETFSGKIVFANPEMQKKAEEAKKRKKNPKKANETKGNIIVYLENGTIIYCKNVKYGSDLIILEGIKGIEKSRYLEDLIDKSRILEEIFLPSENIEYIFHYKR